MSKVVVLSKVSKLSMVSKVSKVPKPSGEKENLSARPLFWFWVRPFFSLSLDYELKVRLQNFMEHIN